MSRFHDEFFRQKGPKHDELMLRCIETIDTLAIHPPLETDKICLFECKNSAYESLGLAPVGGQRYGCEVCTRHNNCPIPYYDKNTKAHVFKVTQIFIRSENSFETEVICKSRDFIIGYADLVIKTTAEGKLSTQLQYGGKECSVFPAMVQRRVYYTIIEIKPEISDIGAVIRQLKTYKDSLLKQDGYKNSDDVSLAIVTESEVKDSIKKYLEHEGIHIIRFAEGA